MTTEEFKVILLEVMLPDMNDKMFCMETFPEQRTRIAEKVPKGMNMWEFADMVEPLEQVAGSNTDEDMFFECGTPKLFIGERLRLFDAYQTLGKAAPLPKRENTDEQA